MTTAKPSETALLVFVDQQGDYYLLPPEVVARCRVGAEDKATVEALVEQREDTAGFALVFQGTRLALVGSLPEPIPRPLARYSDLPEPLPRPGEKVGLTPIQLP